ncbi:MAG: transposase [Prosthecobacter sp.]|nr:transposase [Prosthecobacter sp.]
MSCYCVMPNHVHVVVKPTSPHEPADLLHSWKGFTAKEINHHLQRSGAVWEPESYDTLVRDTEHLWKVIRYIGKNPAKARLPKDQWSRHIDPAWQNSGWGFGEESGG